MRFLGLKFFLLQDSDFSLEELPRPLLQKEAASFQLLSYDKEFLELLKPQIQQATVRGANKIFKWLIFVSFYKAAELMGEEGKVCFKNKIDNVVVEFGDTEGGNKRAAKDDHIEF